jgi:D-alanyl-D-alanine carboxypeptidase
MSLYRVRQSASIALAAVALCVTANAAEASSRHHHHHRITHSTTKNDGDGKGDVAGETSSRYADFVVDAKTGRVLHASNPDALRHPASLTKMMTLYIMFEELERGRFTMDSPLKVSQHASVQSPTKLNLRPGQEISVSDAIHGLVTQSANDAAVTIAENIAGSEDAFARRMTQTARRIGMSNTTFYNASGLPNPDQYTTARDMVTLGRALQERFPENYKVFSTRSFAYRGRVYGNHNHLLGRIEGIDGIKTGYTEASGFNLVTSLHRDGHFVVAAVMGGSSGAARDAQMVRLLEAHVAEASTGPKIASVFTDVRMAARDGDEKPSAPINVTSSRQEGPRVETGMAGNRNQAKDVMPTPILASAVETPEPAKATRSRNAPHPPAADHTGQKLDEKAATAIMAKAITADQKHKQIVASLDNFIPLAPTSKPAAASTPTKPDADGPVAKPASPKADVTGTVETEKPHAADPAKTHVAMAAPPTVHEGWLIQIAAVDNAVDARAILAKAKSAAGDRLASGTPVTEPFSKGGATLYRARFAGFADQKAANAACSSLKRKDFACLVMHQ